MVRSDVPVVLPRQEELELVSLAVYQDWQGREARESSLWGPPHVVRAESALDEILSGLTGRTGLRRAALSCLTVHLGRRA